MHSLNLYILILPIWTNFLISGSYGLPDMDVNLILTSPTLEGEDLEVRCMFEVPQRTSVSSVKWYKGSREIFRYEHKPVPKKQVLPFGNLTVDETLSNVQTLWLKHIPAFMTGEISCEVTLEDPSAKAVTKSAKLLVLVAPKEKPSLEVSLVTFSHKQNIHQTLIANCTSGPSMPATNLTIYINDSPIVIDAKKGRLRTQPDILVNNSLVVRRIELELEVSQEQFINGKLRVKCASSLFNLRNVTSDEFVSEQTYAKPQQRNSQLSGTQYGIVGRNMAAEIGVNIWFITKYCAGEILLRRIVGYA